MSTLPVQISSLPSKNYLLKKFKAGKPEAAGSGHARKEQKTVVPGFGTKDYFVSSLSLVCNVQREIAPKKN